MEFRKSLTDVLSHLVDRCWPRICSVAKYLQDELNYSSGKPCITTKLGIKSMPELYKWKDETAKNNMHPEYTKMILRIFNIFFKDILVRVSDTSSFGLKHLDKSVALFTAFSTKEN